MNLFRVTVVRKGYRRAGEAVRIGFRKAIVDQAATNTISISKAKLAKPTLGTARNMERRR